MRDSRPESRGQTDLASEKALPKSVTSGILPAAGCRGQSSPGETVLSGGLVDWVGGCSALLPFSPLRIAS